MAESAGKPYFILTTRGDLGPVDRSGMLELLANKEISGENQVRNAFGRNLGSVRDLLRQTTEAIDRRPRPSPPARSGRPPWRILIPLVVGLAVIASAWLLSSGGSPPMPATPPPQPAPAVAAPPARIPTPAAPPVAVAALPRVVFQETLADPAAAVQTWHNPGPLDIVDGPAGAKAMRLTSTSAVGYYIQTELPIAKLAGHTVRWSAQVKAVGVSAKPSTYNGVKMMLQITCANGDRLYPQPILPDGSWDWIRVECGAEIPPDATAANLFLALEQVTGSVWFSGVTVEVLDAPRR